MKGKHVLAQVAATALLCLACDRGTLFHHYEHVRPEGWIRTDTLQFALPPAPREGNYTFFIGMRYANDFPYEGIWMIVETQLSQPSYRRCDTLYCAMNDASGMPTGQGIGLLQYEVPLHVLPLQKGQTGSVSLHHIMTREILPDISDIGLRVTSR